jgi:branched-subunit amino acid ABC-type transport system permease component
VGNLLIPVVGGLGQGAVLFLVAVGLSLQIGVMKLLNFSNGAFFMLGGYFAVMLFGSTNLALWQIVVSILFAALAAAAVGAVSEVLVIRRLYDYPGLYPFLGTFALLLIIQGIVIQFFGQRGRSSMQSPVFNKTVEVFGSNLSVYNLVLIAVGTLTAVGVSAAITRTSLGRQVSATAYDRDMASILGINVKRVYFMMLVLSTGLAGLAGGLVSPLIELTPNAAITLLIEAFAVIIIGGAGSVSGTFVAAMGVGVVQSLLVRQVPEIADISIYVLMALILLVRPQGLLGRKLIAAV